MDIHALLATGTDFQGRPESLRSDVVIGKDLGFSVSYQSIS